MKNKIKRTFTKNTNKLLFIAMLAFFAFAPIQAQIAAGETPAQIYQREHAAIKTISLRCGDNSALINNNNFQIGKEFSLAVFDAARMKESTESQNFLIVDLVYLTERLENQPEAAKLQTILKLIVRDARTAEQISDEIQSVAKEYANRQKAEQKWYYSVGQNSVNLLFSSYANDSAQTAANLSEAEQLVKNAPANAPKKYIEPLNALLKYAAVNSFGEKDYAAILHQSDILTKIV